MLPRNESYSFLAFLLGILLCVEIFGSDLVSDKKPVPTSPIVSASLHR